MANAVSSTNLLSGPWDNVYEEINNRTYVADPVGGSAEQRKFVYSRDPDTKSMDFAGYPYIIARPALTGFGNKTEQTGNTQIQTVMFDVELEIVTSDVAANNLQGQGNAHLNAIGDDILTHFQSITTKNRLRSKGLLFGRPNVTSNVMEEQNDTLVYRRSIMVSFEGKKKVY